MKLSLSLAPVEMTAIAEERIRSGGWNGQRTEGTTDQGYFRWSLCDEDNNILKSENDSSIWNNVTASMSTSSDSSGFPAVQAKPVSFGVFLRQ